jgi:hypothetical protein
MNAEDTVYADQSNAGVKGLNFGAIAADMAMVRTFVQPQATCAAAA